MASKKLKANKVTDEQGRQRFHGAFTGGFSAGYFNTVGSEEGFKPKGFVSSRSNRANVSERSAKDYADESDGLVGGSLTAEKVMDSFAGPKSAGAHAGDDAESALLSEMTIVPTNTIGKRLLSQLGWKHGQGVGPRQKRKLLPPQSIALGGGADVTQNPERLNVPASALENGSITYAPKDEDVARSIVAPSPKSDYYGFGYDPAVANPELASLYLQRRSRAAASGMAYEPVASTAAVAAGDERKGYLGLSYRDDGEDIAYDDAEDLNPMSARERSDFFAHEIDVHSDDDHDQDQDLDHAGRRRFRNASAVSEKGLMGRGGTSKKRKEEVSQSVAEWLAGGTSTSATDGRSGGGGIGFTDSDAVVGLSISTDGKPALEGFHLASSTKSARLVVPHYPAPTVPPSYCHKPPILDRSSTSSSTSSSSAGRTHGAAIGSSQTLHGTTESRVAQRAALLGNVDPDSLLERSQKLVQNNRSVFELIPISERKRLQTAAAKTAEREHLRSQPTINATSADEFLRSVELTQLPPPHDQHQLQHQHQHQNATEWVQGAVHQVRHSVPPLPPPPCIPPPPPPSAPPLSAPTLPQQPRQPEQQVQERQMLTSSALLQSTAFQGLSEAFKSRFTSASSTTNKTSPNVNKTSSSLTTTASSAGTVKAPDVGETLLKKVGGLSTLSEFKAASSSAGETAETVRTAGTTTATAVGPQSNASVPAAGSIAKSVRRKLPVRFTSVWAPASLVCKRCNIKMPDIAKARAMLPAIPLSTAGSTAGGTGTGANSASGTGKGALDDPIMNALFACTAGNDKNNNKSSNNNRSISNVSSSSADSASTVPVANLEEDTYLRPISATEKLPASAFRAVFHSSDEGSVNDEEEQEEEVDKGSVVDGRSVDERAIAEERKGGEDKRTDRDGWDNEKGDKARRTFSRAAASEEERLVRHVEGVFDATSDTGMGIGKGVGASSFTGGTNINKSGENATEIAIGGPVFIPRKRPRAVGDGHVGGGKIADNIYGSGSGSGRSGSSSSSSSSSSKAVMVGGRARIGARARSGVGMGIGAGSAGGGEGARKRPRVVGSLLASSAADEEESEDDSNGASGSGSGIGVMSGAGAGVRNRGGNPRRRMKQPPNLSTSLSDPAAASEDRGDDDD